MPDRAALLVQAEQGLTMALQALQALKATEVAPGLEITPAGTVASPAHGLGAPAQFFDVMRASSFMGPTLSQQEVTGCGAILDACAAAEWPISWTAYALATAFHETAGTMQPIREYGRGKGRKYGVPGADGQTAYGRGYIQLTWPDNYSKMDKRLSLNGRLVANYDLALDPDIAAQIMLVGMQEGIFTGKKLADTLPTDEPANEAQFTASRPIINGNDRAKLIASYALIFQSALTKGSWA